MRLSAAVAAALLVMAAPAAAQTPFQNGSVVIVNVGQGRGAVNLIDPLGTQNSRCGDMGPGESCTRNFLVAPFLRLGVEARANGGSFVAGWSLPCPTSYPSSTRASCQVDLDALFGGLLVRRIEVNFGRLNDKLVVTQAGDGSGLVRSNPAGIACEPATPADCSARFPDGTSVTLTAQPHDGSQFAGWSGACIGTGACVVRVSSGVFHIGNVIVNEENNVQALFTRPPTRDRPRLTRGLLVTRLGNGDGQVRTMPRSAGIDCGQDCTALAATGSRVRLLATAAAGSRFVRWRGACATPTALTCEVTMSRDWHVSATFARVKRRLRVTKESGGAVVSTPPGISCDSEAAQTCSAGFDQGTEVALSAEPATGYGFAGWEGACTGQRSCSVVMDADKAVTARFVAVRSLQIVPEGTGAGAILAGGGFCDLGCSVAVPLGGQIAVLAQAHDGSTFTGYSGACSGTGLCAVVMDADKTVGVRFDAPPGEATLTVGLSGEDQGHVTSDAPGIDCRPDCVESFTLDTQVKLTARPADGFTFSRFAGPCTSVQGASCTVRLGESRQILAVFSPVPTPAPPTGEAPPPAETAQPAAGVTNSPAGLDVAVDARIENVRARRAARRRVVRVTLVTGERVTGTAWLNRSGRTLVRRRFDLAGGRRVITLRVRRAARAGRAQLRLTVRDAAGNVRTLRRTVRVPRR